jgi:signal transduction histidine kinase
MYLTIQSEGSKSLVDMNELLAAVRKHTGNKLKAENLQINCSDLPVLKGYPKLLSLLFHHLLDNALKFRHPGRNVIVQIDCTEKDSTELDHPAAIAGKRYYVISVTDNGLGFSHEHMQAIFGLFYRIPVHNAPKGSGMGLAICKKIMDLHGGFISAESMPGKGSRFDCYFPIESINFLREV